MFFALRIGGIVFFAENFKLALAMIVLNIGMNFST